MATLLIIDDEVELCEIHAAYAGDLGWHCLTANDSTTALQILAKQDVDLVMTDMKMPGLSGIDFLREKIVRGFYHPVIICSASVRSFDDIFSKKENHRVIAVLDKPIAEDKLAQALALVWQQKKPA